MSKETDKEQAEDHAMKLSTAYWAGRLIGHDQAWEVAQEIVDELEWMRPKPPQNIDLSAMDDPRIYKGSSIDELRTKFERDCGIFKGDGIYNYVMNELLQP